MSLMTSGGSHKSAIVTTTSSPGAASRPVLMAFYDPRHHLVEDLVEGRVRRKAEQLLGLAHRRNAFLRVVLERFVRDVPKRLRPLVDAVPDVLGELEDRGRSRRREITFGPALLAWKSIQPDHSRLKANHSLSDL